MRIIRFLDENNKICYGHDFADNTTFLLNGDLFNSLDDTKQRINVKKILAPVIPSSIMCVGLNYKEHAGEIGFELPEYPAVFMKNPASLNNPGDPIIVPRVCMEKPELDYEVELAVIIGKRAKDVPETKALEYVLGYTIANDVSARRWQAKAGGGQWVRGKSFDTFCPIGPVLVTADEMPDPQNLRIQCLLNGELMQDAATSGMIFPVAKLIAYLSQDTTLIPGTAILTGTPGGVGYTRKPPVYLKNGDVLELKIDNIGTLVNRVEEIR